MKRIEITDELLEKFRKKPQTLIMEGYCENIDGTKVYTDGRNFATVASCADGGTKICIDGDDKNFIDCLLSMQSGSVEFCGVSPYITEYLGNKYGCVWKTECRLFVWNGIPVKDVTELPPIDSKYAAMISDGTHYKPSVNEVTKCLRLHPSSAVYVDGNPVCWCLVHAEGSLGMLYTVPQHRRKGYALQVMKDLTDKVIKRGKIPFAFIVVDNEASVNLAAKYNLSEVCRADYFEIKVSD